MTRGFSSSLACAVGALLWGMVPVAAAAAPPEIRLSANNQVPACVTPDRLMTFLKARNHSLDARFKDIAGYYKQHGEGWNVRWDYAFFQMAIETNFLTYKRPNGDWGDVDPKQNNFAGIGTTGGGVPGDRFPDVKTGVLGQIQHLVAYSGEHMAEPVAARTQLKQDDIILESQKLGRPVRFSDLARRWAVDPKYGASIEWVADAYRSEHCKGGDGAKAASAEVLPWATAPVEAAKPAAKKSPDLKTRPLQSPLQSEASVSPTPAPVLAVKPQSAVRTVWVSSPRGETKLPAAPAATPVAQRVNDAAAPQLAAPVAVATDVPVAARPVMSATASPPPSGLGVKPPMSGTSAPCRVASASYGGKKTVLISAAIDGEQRYTALSVLDGFEKSMTDTFIKSRAPGGQMLGEFPDQNAAIAKAHELCPGS